MTIETKELVISKELKRKVEMICRFAYVKYEFINGNIKSIKKHPERSIKRSGFIITNLPASVLNNYRLRFCFQLGHWPFKTGSYLNYRKVAEAVSRSLSLRRSSFLPLFFPNPF